MFDRILMILEIGLLVWIVIQGEIIVRCEKGVYQLQKEREGERAKWREQKRSQQLKKETASKTNDSNSSTALPSPSESSAPPNKITSVKSAEALSTPTVTRA